MARDITVTFDDGSTAQYKNAPDNITPDAVTARAQKDYGKNVTALDGGRKPDQSGLIPALTSSFRAGAAGTSEALGELTGIEGLTKFGKEQQEKAAGMFTPTTEADVEAAKEKGILPAAGAYMSKYLTEPVGEAVGSIAGRYGAPIAIGGMGLVFPEVALPLAAAGFATNASIHTGENLMRQKEVGKQPDYLSATTYGIGQAAVDQFAGHILTAPMKSIIGRTAVEEARLLAPRVLKGELTADEAAQMVGGKLRNVAQATAQNAVVGAGMMTADEAMRRASAGQELTSPEALDVYKQQAITAAELSPLFGLAHGLGQPAKARAALEAVEKLKPPPPPPPAAEAPPPTAPSGPPLLEGPKAPPPAETPALPFNPLPGTPAVFPDGTVALTPQDVLTRRYAPQAGTPEEPIAGFTTSKGSTYQLTPEGKTVRTKLSPGEGQGQTFNPHSVLYVSPDSQQRILNDKNAGGKDHSVRLGYISTKEGEAPTIRTVADHADIPEGAKPVVAVINTDKNTVVGVYPASRNPAVGMHPVEKLYNKDGTSSTHLGNEIVDIQRNRAMPEPQEPAPIAQATPEAVPEVVRSELEQLQAQHAELTQKMDALRIAKTGKPPTPLSKAGKEFAALADQRDQVANRLAEISPEPPYQEAVPIEGKPALVSPEDKAEYETKAKELKQALKETKSELSKAKKEGYSLFQVLKGSLNENEISKRDDPQYKQLIAKKGKQGSALSSLIEDGLLNDFLPLDNRPGLPTYDWQKAEEHIREKLYSKNYVTTETELAVENLGRKVEDLEIQIDKHLTLKEINGLLEEAANEQRAIDQAAETIAPEGKNRAAPPSEAAPAEPKVKTEKLSDLLEQSGFEKLHTPRVQEQTNPKVYVDKSGQWHPTWEKDGARISLGQGETLFAEPNKRDVTVYQGEPEDVTIHALMVDPSNRGQGKAAAALKSLIDIADQKNQTLYIEPQPLEKGAMNAQQLVDFYKKFGFEQQVKGDDRVLVRKPNATEGFELKAETPDEVRAKQADAEARAAEEARAAKEAEDKAKANAEVGEFTLTGSDREADVAAARGQKDIFAEDSRAQLNDKREEIPEAKPVSALPEIKPPEGFKPKEGRKTEVVMAARELAAGRITKEQYDRYVDEYMPINTILGDNLEAPLKPEQLKTVLKLPKVGKADDKIDAPIADGTRVGLRMDIPALKEARKAGMNGSVVSIHKGSKPENASEGENLSYKSAGAIKDVVFAPRKEEDSLKIAMQAEPEKYIAKNGEEKLRKVADKKPQQTMEGLWVNRTPEEIFKQVKDILAGKTPDADQWVQVSLDPLRHSYFYDRANKRPVLSASEVLQVGRFVLAKDVKYGNREEFLYMKDKVDRKGTPEQIADRDERVKMYGGDVIYQDGDTGVYRTFNLTGDPLYRAFKGDNRLRVNLEDYTGNLFTARDKIVLGKAIEDWKKADAERYKNDPFVKFDKDGIAMSQSIPEDLAGVFKEWKKMLKIDKNIYLTTVEDTRANRLLFTGEHASIGAAGLHDSLGMMQRMRNGDYFIAFKPNTSKAKMLETLGHEMGHIHELEVFNKQDAATKAAIKDEYQKWLAGQKNKSAQELIESLRARKTGKATEVDPGVRAEQLSAYWKSFGEWYADQTARWATTQEKPLTVVEKFFSKLGAAMKAFYAKLRNGKYLPNETFRDYMDRVTDSVMNAADRPENMVPLVSGQMELNFMLDGVKDRAQQMLQKRAPMNQKGFAHIDPALLDEINRHFFAPNKTIIDRIDSLKGRMWQYVAQKTADEFRTIKEYSRLGHMMATLSKDTNGALESLLFHGHVTLKDGALDVLSGPNRKGLIEALKPVGRELDTFHVWMALNREANLPENQRSHDLDALVARKDDFIKGDINGVPREQVYKQVQKDVMAINKSVLGVALQTGLIDRFAYERFAKDEFYIPFYRMLEDGKIESMNQAARLTGKEFSKMLKGNNDKPFGDLMENTLRNWNHILSASMKNQAANVTIEAAREQGAVRPALKPGLAWETDADGKNGRVVSATTGKVVGNGELVQERQNAAGETELVSMTEPKTGAKDVVRTQVDGVTTYHHVEDPLLFESIAAVSGGGPKGLAIDVMRPFKELLRFGVTVSPTFKVSNFIKDSIQAPAVSELSPNIIKNMYNGLYDARKGSPIYQSALAGGGIFNYGSALEGDRSAAIRKLISRGVDEATILDTPDKVKNFFASSWRKYEELGNLSEAANRVALYKQLRDRGLSHLEASFQARDLMNFSAMGSSNAIRFVSATVPFFNARVQGLYKLGRDGILPTARVAYNTLTGKEMWSDPQNKLSDIQKAKSFASVSAAACLASIALYMANKDDKDFQKREQWDRDFFWWSKVPGTDYAVRIPKPFEIGALATLAERTIEQMVDAGVDGKRFGESLSRMVWQTFSMNPVPQFVKPMVDIYANKNYFTNAPIETAGMERLSKQERITDSTSPLAKALGGFSHAMAPLTGELGEMSPVQIDYLIRAYFGWLGGTVLATSTQAVKPFNNGVYPSTDWTKPLTLGFVEKEPSPQSAYLTDFYHNNQAIQQAYADMRHYAQLGQSEKVMEIMTEKKDELALARFYDAQSKQLANIRKQLLTISNPKYTGLTSDQKEEEILRLKQLMSDVAQQAETVRKSMRVNP